MTIDLITLILGAAVLLLAALTPLLSPFFRKCTPTSINEATTSDEVVSTAADEAEATDDVADTNSEPEAEQAAFSPALTVLITVQPKQAPMLAQHLPEFLSQDYPNYEVVVVAEKGDSDSEDVINLYASDSRLYATYVPDSSRYMSRKKLAITLGTKAAKNEWIVLVDAFCAPSGNRWLATLARHLDESHNLVIGYSNFDNEAKPYYRFERLQQACYTMREAAFGTAYRAIEGNIAFRKSEFIHGDGYRGNLQDIRGEYDFLVNKYARKKQTAVAAERNAWLIYDTPTRHAWRNMHIFYMHTRKHLSRSFKHRLLPFIDETALHLTFIACISSAVFAALTERWLLLGAAIVALIGTAVLRTVIAKKVFNAFEEDIAAWKIYPFELSGIWHKMYQRLRYWRANKTDFTSHKV